VRNFWNLLVLFIAAVAVMFISLASAEAEEKNSISKRCERGKKCEIRLGIKLKLPETKQVPPSGRGFDFALGLGGWGGLTDSSGGVGSWGMDARLILSLAMFSDTYLRLMVAPGVGWRQHQVLGAPGKEKWELQRLLISYEAVGIEFRGDSGSVWVGPAHRIMSSTEGVWANEALATLGFSVKLWAGLALNIEFSGGWSWFTTETFDWKNPLLGADSVPPRDVGSGNGFVFEGGLGVVYTF